MEGFVHKTDNWFVQADVHEAILPPSPIPVPLVLHLGGGRLSWGWGHKDNKGTVLADGQRAVSREHSVKHCIPHYNVTPPWPPNVLLAVIIPFSENKLEFGAARVQAPDGPLAMALFRVIGPSMACNDPCMMPTSRVYTGGTVLVGFSFADVLAGIYMSIQDAAMDAVANFLGGELGDALKNPLGEALEEGVEEVLGESIEEAAEEGLERLMGENAEEIVEEILGGLAGDGVMEINAHAEEAMQPEADSFTNMSNGIDQYTAGLSGSTEAMATSLLFGGPTSPGGAAVLFSQSELLTGD